MKTDTFSSAFLRPTSVTSSSVAQASCALIDVKTTIHSRESFAMAIKSTTANEVFLYIPNLIGYLRVACALLSFILMICFPERWVVAITLYVASFVGDLFDGIAARKFDQCSAFGGLLDMVTDRCATAGLLSALSKEYSDQSQLVLVSFGSLGLIFVLLNCI